MINTAKLRATLLGYFFGGLACISSASAFASAPTFLQICKNESGHVTAEQYQIVAILGSANYFNVPLGRQGEGCVELAEKVSAVGKLGVTDVALKDISALQGVEFANLTALNFGNTSISDLSSMSQFHAPRLERVAFLNAPVRDLTPLASIASLREVRGGPAEVDMQDSYPQIGKIEVLPGIGSLSQLTLLQLLYPDLKSFAGLDRLVGLQSLQLHTNAITSLPRELRSLKNVTDLILETTHVKDLSELASMQALRKISFCVADGADYSVLGKLPNLEKVSIGCLDKPLPVAQQKALQTLLPAGAQLIID
jgi:Leucine-rich repeat (LRR) protein